MYLYAAATGIQTLLDPAVWSMATDRSHEAFHALWLPALLLEAAAPALLLAASGYLTVLFFRKSRGFPRLYVAVAVGTLAYAWLDLFLGTFIPAAREQIELVREVGRALGGTLASLAWIAYVLSSKRVKNTFVGAL
jgi:hypothetical protein